MQYITEVLNAICEKKFRSTKWTFIGWHVCIKLKLKMKNSTKFPTKDILNNTQHTTYSIPP